MRAIQKPLNAADRRFLQAFRAKGVHSAREVTRAHILLAVNNQVPIAHIQEVLGVSRMVIWRTLGAYAQKGIERALCGAARPGQPPKYDTDQQAEVAALACSQPPEGAARWTIRLLAIQAGRLPKLEGINRESVRQILKKTHVNLGAK